MVAILQLDVHKCGAMWETASHQLIRALRGKRSQRALSRRLGYRSNPVREWEAGRRFPTAAEALRVASLVGVDVHLGLRRFHPASAHLFDPANPIDDRAVARWLSALRGSLAVVELARRSQRSRFAITRWLGGETRPRLPEFLRLVDAITGRAGDLVSELVDIQVVPSLYTLHRKRRAAQELSFQEPWTEAIMRLFETQSYRALQRHQVGWLAARLGIDIATEDRCVTKMIETDLIAFEDGRLAKVASVSVDTGSNPERVLALKRHWAAVGLERIVAPRGDDLFAYNAMSLSKKDLAAVRVLLQNTYRQIRSIVAGTPTEEVAGLVQLQLINWDAPEPPRSP